MIKDFLFLSDTKSSFSEPLWNNIGNVIDNDDAKVFYARLSTSVFGYFYDWCMTNMVTGAVYGIPIDIKHFHRIINHFVMLCICSINDKPNMKMYNEISETINKYSLHDLGKISKTNMTLNIKESKMILYSSFFNTLTGNYNNKHVELLDKDCKYFDCVGTVIWLWIHLTASALLKHKNIPKTEYYKFFDYLKYILSCSVCRRHYDTDIIPILDKIKSTSKDELMASIELHAIVNVNKYKTRHDCHTVSQETNIIYYNAYINYWNY